MKRIIVALIMVALSSFKVLALDNEVTVLAVYTPTTATKFSQMSQAIRFYTLYSSRYNNPPREIAKTPD